MVLLAALAAVVAVCAQPGQHLSTEGAGSDGSAPPSAAATLSAPRPIAPPESKEIAPGRPVQLAVPALGMDAPVEKGDCRVVDGAIDPARLREACAYTAPDRPYSLPGSDAPDVVVIAGHAAAGVPAVFDSLYDARANRHTVSLGDVLYVRTEVSSSDWLAYRATDVHEPQKDALSASAQIWGTGATPGRLLTISCIQPANPLADSVKNAVVGWQFDQVVSEQQVAANMGWDVPPDKGS
ncbi:hypothetical protein [Corynebacterium mayonis]|uniref:hypothetical protein n=1 Tax=Corynebacterium mayonis TaxID=3062461 RepID=UPI0031405160